MLIITTLSSVGRDIGGGRREEEAYSPRKAKIRYDHST
jgi:hypothetical protein